MRIWVLVAIVIHFITQLKHASLRSCPIARNASTPMLCALTLPRTPKPQRNMASVESSGAVAPIGAASSLSQTPQRRSGQAAHLREESAWSSLYVLRCAPLLYSMLVCVGFAIGFARCAMRRAALQSDAVLLRSESYPAGAGWVPTVVCGLWLAAAVILAAVALAVWRWATALALQGVRERDASSAGATCTVDKTEEERQRGLLLGIVLLRCAAWLYLVSAVCTVLGIGVFTYLDGSGTRAHIWLGPSQQ